jgi:hypothetical protein
MRELVFCLEELSAQRFLEGLVPRLNPNDIPVRYIVFEGKQDLHAQLQRRIRGYRNREASFIILQDQDRYPDCLVVKEELRRLCVSAGRPDAVVRIACRELEAFYWGDLGSVERVLKMPNIAKTMNRAQFRDPDVIVSPATELHKLTKGKYQKVGTSARIGSIINFVSNRSGSFQQLRMAIETVLQ